MRQNGIFRVAKERFDLEVLLDEPKEDFDLPTLLVDIGDGAGRQRHVVGEEIEALPGFLIPIADLAQGQGFFAIGDLDDVIGGDTRCPVRAVALNDPKTGVVLEASDQEDAGFTELSEPRVVIVAPVKAHDRPLGKFEQLGDVDLMAFGFGDGDHSREIAVMVYDRVHLDASLGCSELGPGEQGQA